MTTGSLLGSSVQRLLLALVAERMRDQGLALDLVLGRAGLGSDWSEAPEASGLVPFLDAAAKALSDDVLGFRLALDFDLRLLGALHYALASADTLGEVLACAGQYAALALSVLRIQYRRTADAILLQSEFEGAERHRDRHLTEFWITTLLRECRTLTRLELTPVQATFVHQRSDPPDDMRRYFGSALAFGASSDCLAFDVRAAIDPIASADPFLHQVLLRQLDEAIGRRDAAPNDLRGRIANAVTPRLPEGTVTIEAVAKDLGMSTRTLSRRLSDEGVTFREVLAALRADLALRYIEDPSLPMSRIAWLLGYADASAFVVAFRRWTGMSPSEARAKLRTETPDADPQ